MLDQFFTEFITFVFTDANRLVGLVFIAIFIVIAIVGLSFWLRLVFRAGTLFALLCFILFFPAFAFPNLLDNLYYSLGLIDEFRYAPSEMKTITLFLFTNGVISLSYFVIRLIYDLLRGEALTWNQMSLEDKRAARTEERLRAELQKQAEALRQKNEATSQVVKE